VQLTKQGLVPTALSIIMPTGLLGLFAAVMFAAMLSTDDTYMHSWGSIFIQDVILPFKKKPFTAKQHIRALRFSIIFVAIFAWLFSYFFRQTEYVFMFFAITGAIVSGAGAVIIGGLYWKRGGTIAAWVAFIFGATIAITGIVLQQSWHLQNGNGLAKFLVQTFKWEWVAANMERFPINGQWITFIGCSSCLLIYFVISQIEYYVFKKPDFNLMKMLHRGKYDIRKEHLHQSKTNRLLQRLGITDEFNTRDKLLYAATIGWTLAWMIIFVWFTTQYFLFGKLVDGKWHPGVSQGQWLSLWHVKLYVTLILSMITTVWFLIGGIADVIKLFKSLSSKQRNDEDDGTVVNGHNAGEQVNK
jgi:Sodium:solute symporter family